MLINETQPKLHYHVQCEKLKHNPKYPNGWNYDYNVNKKLVIFLNTYENCISMCKILPESKEKQP